MQFEIGKSFNDIEIGENASFSKTITEADIYLFAGICGDFNPMHINEEYASKTPFKSRIAHAPLTQSLIAPVLGTKLPGLGTVALELFSRFRAPVYIGDTITATAEVKEKLEEKKWVRMKLTFLNQKQKLVAEGEALVMPPTPKT
ncbi:MAG: MaoC family dehydratase [Thermodesulfobacteriota bacterium]|nr:MaoC family dehydratase [Thermodesulfobacteriota bacterium]